MSSCWRVFYCARHCIGRGRVLAGIAVGSVKIWAIAARGFVVSELNVERRGVGPRYNCVLLEYC